MSTALVTGSAGFIGRNLVVRLRERGDAVVLEYDALTSSESDLAGLIEQAGIIYHLAGVNRPQDPSEFATGNTDLTARVCDLAASSPKRPTVVLSSSIQAEQDNPYGASKLAAEEAVRRYVGSTGAAGVVFRLPNVFGKWSRPNYNSAVATFCHNIARDLPITMSDPYNELRLVYVDDVVAAFLALLDDVMAPSGPRGGFRFGEVSPVYRATLGDLVDRIRALRSARDTLMLPDLEDPLNRCLLATYNSFLPTDGLGYCLQQRADERGVLAEFVKSRGAGQIFVSSTRPGVTRGNHYHHTKVEKFLVLKGRGEIALRRIGDDEVHTVSVSGDELRVVDIPTGYTHCIRNAGDEDMVTLFWSSEVFDPGRADTVFEEVERA